MLVRVGMKFERGITLQIRCDDVRSCCVLALHLHVSSSECGRTSYNTLIFWARDWHRLIPSVKSLQIQGEDSADVSNRVPIYLNGYLIGGVGVSGGTGE